MDKMTIEDNRLYKALDKKQRTLNALGYIKRKENIILLIMSYINDLLTGNDCIYVNNEDIMTLRKVISCITKNSCLFADNPVIYDIDIFNKVKGDLRSVGVSSTDYLQANDSSIRYRN